MGQVIQGLVPTSMLLWWETQRVLRNIDAMHPQLAASLRDLCQAMNNKSHDDVQEETAMALAGEVFRWVDDIRFAARIKMPLEWIRTSNPKGFPAALALPSPVQAQCTGGCMWAWGRLWPKGAACGGRERAGPGPCHCGQNMEEVPRKYALHPGRGAASVQQPSIQCNCDSETMGGVCV
jgi:hypothetical protein